MGHLGTGAGADGADLSVGRRIWYSLLGGAVYRRIGAHATGVYVAFLAVAVVTAVTVALAVALSTARGLSAITAAWPHLPDFSVTDGRLVLPAGLSPPVRVAADGAVVVLAERAAPVGDPLDRAKVGLLLTGREMLLRTGGNGGGDQTVPLSAFGSLSLTKASLGSLMDHLAGVGVWIEAGATVVYAIVRDLVRATIIAWVGLISVRFLGRDPGWPQAWRVGLAAWTLPMLAEAARVAVPVPDWALWMVACTYAVTGCAYLTPP